MEWVEQADYYLHTAPQGSKEWLEARSKLKITTSLFEKARLYIENKGPKPNRDPIVPNEAMQLGTKLEPIIREWFKNSGYLPAGCKIIEIGLVVPKFCTSIGASVDGLIVENGSPVGIIEIKTTRKMYESIKNRNGPQSSYILPSHFDQIQGSLACLNLPWCYYILYEHTTNTIHVEKINRDSEYWSRFLYPSLERYIQIC